MRDTVMASTPLASKAATTEHVHAAMPTQSAADLLGHQQQTPRPDMSNMLRDIGSVKLRTVHMAKSPGGTPLRPVNKTGRAAVDPNDPASIIAQALRKKFAHKVFRDSPG